MNQSPRSIREGTSLSSGLDDLRRPQNRLDNDRSLIDTQRLSPSYDGSFKYDLRTLTPVTGLISYGYRYQLYDAQGREILDEAGKPLQIQGTVTVGDDPDAFSIAWGADIHDTQQTQIIHRQTYNTFGQIEHEELGRGKNKGSVHVTPGVGGSCRAEVLVRLEAWEPLLIGE